MLGIAGPIGQGYVVPADGGTPGQGYPPVMGGGKGADTIGVVEKSGGGTIV